MAKNSEQLLFWSKMVSFTLCFSQIAALALKKTIWLTINLIQLNDAKFITLLVCQTDKDKKREKSQYILTFLTCFVELKKKI